MNIRLELEKFKSENSNVIGCGFGDKHGNKLFFRRSFAEINLEFTCIFNFHFFKLGLTMARVGDLNADDVAVGVNTIQEIITATEEAGFSIPRTVTVESYR